MEFNKFCRKNNQGTRVRSRNKKNRLIISLTPLISQKKNSPKLSEN